MIIIKKSILFTSLLIFTFQVSISAAQETSSGTSVNQSQNNERAELGTTLVNSCPKILIDWIADDFEDKLVNLGGQSFLPSKVNECTSKLKGYKKYFDKPNEKAPVGDSEGLSKALANRFPQITPRVSTSLDQCNSLPASKSILAKARFYTAAEKLETYSTSIVDELGYIDSVFPKPPGLAKIECSPQFPFPKLGQRCETYRKELSQACKIKPDEKLAQLVSKTHAAIYEMDELQKSYDACVKQKSADICVPIRIVMERLQAENPWIASDQFKIVRQTLKNQASWPRNKGLADFKKKLDERIEGSLTKYFNDTRDTLVKQHEKNLKNMRCMSYTTSDSNSGCDFKDIRESLVKIPNIPDPQDTKNANYNSEISNLKEVDTCLVESGQKRQEKKDAAVHGAKTVVLTVATWGLGSGLAAIGSGGVKLFQGMSTANRVRAASSTLLATSAVNMVPGLAQAFKSCQKEAEATLKFSNSNEAIKSSVCDDNYSKLQIAKDAENACVTNALLTIPDLIPFVKGLSVLRRGNELLTEKNLLALYKDPAQRQAVEKILAKNGSLSEAERVAAAETLLGKNLTAVEKQCVKDAHNIGDGRVMRTATTEALEGENLLTQKDLFAKRSALSKCGFDVTEVSLLMRSGITGWSDPMEVVKRNYDQMKKNITEDSFRTSKVTSVSHSYERLLGESAHALGKYDEGQAALIKAYNVRKNYLTNAGPREMSLRDLDELSNLAAYAKDAKALEDIEVKHIKAMVEDVKKRAGSDSFEAIKAADKGSEMAISEYIADLQKLARSSNKGSSEMANEKLKVLKAKFPGYFR